jgi:DNA-binding MarR family transcriptional regulator
MADYIRNLGELVLDHRFRRMMDVLLKEADRIYRAVDLPFKAKWASTYRILLSEGPIGIMAIAERLRLTHPAVIGLTDEMITAGLVEAVRDDGDARRRLVRLSARGQRLAPRLNDAWKLLAKVQRERFRSAGCDIIGVLDEVEDSFESKSISEEVVERLRPRGQRRIARSTATVIVAFTAITLGISACSRNARPGRSEPVAEARAEATLVAAIADSLIGGYLYEDRARIYADSLRAALGRGEFSAAQPDSVAARITRFLRRVGNDRHLYVSFGPAGESAGATPVRRMRVPAGSPTPSQPGAPEPVRLARTEILPGNVGYLELRGFPGEPEALAVVDSIMRGFAGVKGLIIDVGRNRGGGPEMVRLVSTYLFDKPIHLVTTVARGMESPMERWTLDSVSGRRLSQIPVFILTSPNTISAAESFAFGLRVTGRAKLVGERTAGGGHFGRFVDLPGGYRMFLPFGRTYDPRTGEGWEAEGIKPDVEAPYEKAKETALALINSAGR